ncbi:hypothetical protein B0H10DRAFT_2218930 [Mycena sp. CBHHK59/15]|nr:hypothetical protein B0H10DRAFT_2218930 [Mycena sp. CBHHK59/15]
MRVTVYQVAMELQVMPANLLVGLEGRTSLLTNLSTTFHASSQFFGPDARIGHLIDYLEVQFVLSTNGMQHVFLTALWHALIAGLHCIAKCLPIWPPMHTDLLKRCTCL